jgi:hypothetical protein
MHMRSSFDSDPEDFPIRVLSQSFLVGGNVALCTKIIV